MTATAQPAAEDQPGVPDPYPREQTRARYPDSTGYVERDGVRLYHEVYGSGEPTIFLLPTWSIIHSRHWKMQIPYLARHCRVITFDGRGNGRSDRPAGADAYRERQFAADALAVMDATGTARAGPAGGAAPSLVRSAGHTDLGRAARADRTAFSARGRSPRAGWPAGRRPAAGRDRCGQVRDDLPWVAGRPRRPPPGQSG
jgi:pimeloyl-ACP methyl ester carboxylesterase